jgi:hypothetical protein
MWNGVCFEEHNDQNAPLSPECLSAHTDQRKQNLWFTEWGFTLIFVNSLTRANRSMWPGGKIRLFVGSAAKQLAAGV